MSSSISVDIEASVCESVGGLENRRCSRNTPTVYHVGTRSECESRTRSQLVFWSLTGTPAHTRTGAIPTVADRYRVYTHTSMHTPDAQRPRVDALTRCGRDDLRRCAHISKMCQAVPEDVRHIYEDVRTASSLASPPAQRLRPPRPFRALLGSRGAVRVLLARLASSRRACAAHLPRPPTRHNV